MVGKTFTQIPKDRARYEDTAQQLISHSFTPTRLGGNAEATPLGLLADPLVQDLDHTSRTYLFYCELPPPPSSAPILINVHTIVADHVCKDFILYDIPKSNAFRDLVPLTQWHPALLQIIIATSALRMSNALQKFAELRIPLRSGAKNLSSRTSISSSVQQRDSYNHALTAKQRALQLLKSALANITAVDVDVTLAVILLFIEFELIDSGRDNWRYHINGARSIIESLCGSAHTSMTPLRRWLISNCLL
jgi:hypothetical protein